jgi:hypothetical protein
VESQGEEYGREDVISGDERIEEQRDGKVD